MLAETRDVLSLALYLADIVSCTTRVIVQDGIDLIAQGLKKKAEIALLAGFAVPSSNIVLWDIAFVVTKELLPSNNLTFLLVTN